MIFFNDLMTGIHPIRSNAYIKPLNINARKGIIIMDVDDAVRSKKFYKSLVSHQETCELIMRDNGTHFEPALLKYLLNCRTNLMQCGRISENNRQKSGRDACLFTFGSMFCIPKNMAHRSSRLRVRLIAGVQMHG